MNLAQIFLEDSNINLMIILNKNSKPLTILVIKNNIFPYHVSQLNNAWLTMY